MFGVFFYLISLIPQMINNVYLPSKFTSNLRIICKVQILLFKDIMDIELYKCELLRCTLER